MKPHLCAGSECVMIRAHATVLYWLLLACLSFGCQAEKRYCNNGVVSPLILDESENRDKTIFPVVLGETDQTKLSNKSCRWSIELSNPTTGANLQLVLQVFPMDSDADITSLPKSDQKSPAELAIKYSGGKIIAKVGMFFVRRISLLFPLTVEASWDPRFQTASQVKLRLLVIRSGFCNDDMLSFNRNCYAVNKARANLTAAMSDIRGDAQLASFSSMAEIDSLIAANTARLSVHPYRQPLSLSQPVHLGMFYRAEDSSVLSVVRNGSGSCSLNSVLKPAEFVGSGGMAGPCLTLKVDTSDTAVVEFIDCSSTMLVLIKFPESRSSASDLESCKIPILDMKFPSPTVENIAESTKQSGTTSLLTSTQKLQIWATSENPSPKSPASKLPISLGTAFGIVLAILLVVLVIVCIHRNKCSCNDCAIQIARKGASKNENFPLEDIRDGSPGEPLNAPPNSPDEIPDSDSCGWGSDDFVTCLPFPMEEAVPVSRQTSARIHMVTSDSETQSRLAAAPLENTNS